MSYIGRHVLNISSLVIAGTLCLVSGSAMAWTGPGRSEPAFRDLATSAGRSGK